MQRSARMALRTALCAVALFAAGCSVPHRIVSQKDVAARQWNDPASGKAVLVASRSSPFKDRVVQGIEEGLRGEDVFVKVVGVDDLAREDGGAYGAVVLINTCMAWRMDPAIEAFLERQARPDHVIVLTTSADGEWEPKRGERPYDTVTSASEPYDPEAVAAGIVEKVNRLLAGEAPGAPASR